jgi:methylmalonyl-CoA/ethylmalonyl-CoA epimerase
MTASVVFDHLAIGVESWSAGFPRFASELGGQWSHGGDAGEFAACQLAYRHGIGIELIAPSASGGFVRRFLDRGGPRPHHLTFKVPSLAEALTSVEALGIHALGGRTGMPFWKEVFLHPRLTGLGTLVQLVEADEEVVGRALHASPAPAGFPPLPGDPPGDRPGDRLGISWTGLTVRSLTFAEDLFGGILAGSVAERGAGWFRVAWGAGCSLLVRLRSASPGAGPLWDDSLELGVDHVVFGPGSLTVGALGGTGTRSRLPDDLATNLPVWLVAGTVAAVRPSTSPGACRTGTSP